MSSQREDMQIHPDPIARMVIEDLVGNKGWSAARDTDDGHLELVCPHGEFRFAWPDALAPRERWDDVFKRMNAEHKKVCTQGVTLRAEPE